MPSLAELTDAYAAPDDTFPVEQPAESIRVVIRTPKKEEKKEDRPEPFADDYFTKPVAPMPELPSDNLVERLIKRLAETKFSEGTKLGHKLTGSNGEERYQLWPEKIINDAITAPHAVATEGTIAPGLRREDFTDIPAPQMPTKDSTWLGNALGVAPVASSPADDLIDKAQAMSAVAGSGGLAGVAEDGIRAGTDLRILGKRISQGSDEVIANPSSVALGSAPFLRPALKYENKIYKAPVNGQHLDALPAHLQDTFQKQAMSGEDISNFNFGFMNHKGQFLSREAALDYAIKEGLLDPHAGQYGALTTSLLADSSKPGTAIEAMAKSNKYPLAQPSERFTNTLGQNDKLIQNMTPDEFLNKSRPLKIDAESRENIDALKKHIKEGKPLDPLELHANGKEDGRHRAIAAKELGIKEVPVINFREPSQSLKMVKATPNDHDGNPITDYHGNPINITEDGKLVLYHRTNEQSKNNIYNTGKFKSKENTNETFFSDNHDSEYGKGFGDHVVAVKVDPKFARLNDQFPSGENHYAISNKYLSKANILKSDNEAGAAIQSIKQPFYSAVEHQVNQIAQPKMTGDQWLGTLSNKAGVKPEELDWTGLKNFLQEKGKQSVTKQEVQEHLNNNKVELKDVDKGAASLNKASPYYDKELERVLNSDSRGTFDDMHLTLSNDAKAYKILTSKHPELKAVDDWAGTVLNSVVKGGGDTKYHGYQLPGGENYREKLLTLPHESKIKWETTPEGYVTNGKYTIKNEPFQDQPNYITYGEGGRRLSANDSLANAKNLIEMAGNNEAKSNLYRSSHWDEPNIIAHVRMNDRTMSEPGYRITNLKSGNTSKTFPTYEEALTYANSLPESLKKNIQINEGISPKKSLHLEEIQSDWHQQGREKGYAKNPAEFEKLNTQLKAAEEELTNHKQKIAEEHLGMSWQKFRNENKDAHIRNQTLEELNQVSQHDPKYINLLRKAEALREATNEANPINKVPDAPFKKSWHELALKRMIREAAEKGYDRLSWTPGEAQAARYDLSKQISKLELTHNRDGAGELIMVPKKESVQQRIPVPIKNREDLVNAVGKDLADKLYEQGNKNNGKATLEGLDLKVGGEGMKGFYDQIIPKALEKIGKEHGVKVKLGRVDYGGNPHGNKYGWEKDGDYYYITTPEGRLPSPNGGEPRRFESRQAVQHEMKTLMQDKTSQPIHYIDIPQSLKDQAMHKGFPLFSGGYQFIPVVGNPFNKDDKK